MKPRTSFESLILTLLSEKDCAKLRKLPMSKTVLKKLILVNYPGGSRVLSEIRLFVTVFTYFIPATLHVLSYMNPVQTLYTFPLRIIFI